MELRVDVILPLNLHSEDWYLLESQPWLMGKKWRELEFEQQTKESENILVTISGFINKQYAIIRFNSVFP